MSTDETEDQAQATLDEVAKRRAARRERIAQARKLQEAKDELALEELYDSLGEDAVGVHRLEVFKEGFPTLVAVEKKTGQYAKRFMQQVQSDKREQRQTAVDQLVDVSVKYPSLDEYKRLKAEFEGVHDKVAMVAVKLMQAERVEEKKG